MQKVDKKGIQRIHALLAKIGMANDKEYKLGLVQQYTNNRETSTTGLFVNEAGLLISDLQRLVEAKPLTPEQYNADRKRKLMFHYAHQMNWELDGGKVDIARVNAWCVKYGQYHKALMEHNSSELSFILVQFEKVYKDYLKAV